LKWFQKRKAAQTIETRQK